MAICLIVENPDQTQEQTERALAHVRSTGPAPRWRDEHAGIPLDRMQRTVFELHTLTAGDLTGVLQPA